MSIDVSQVKKILGSFIIDNYGIVFKLRKLDLEANHWKAVFGYQHMALGKYIGDVGEIKVDAESGKIVSAPNQDDVKRKVREYQKKLDKALDLIKDGKI
ncbi:MAG: hypothetical protein ACUVXA_03075 [Candidatus Jordarchaeum sp.]|uniref:hypothetical protein n=1 Tax=Candidatus Jordarchaeum sp. TaxID=2823881 RepID=UPI0040493260